VYEHYAGQPKNKDDVFRLRSYYFGSSDHEAWRLTVDRNRDVRYECGTWLARQGTVTRPKFCTSMNFRNIIIIETFIMLFSSKITTKEAIHSIQIGKLCTIVSRNVPIINLILFWRHMCFKLYLGGNMRHSHS